MVTLLIEIFIENKYATVASNIAIGDDIIGPFGVAEAEVVSKYKARLKTKPTADDRRKIMAEVMEIITPTVLEVWPHELNFDNVAFVLNYKALAEHMAKHGAQPRWIYLAKQRRFNPSLTEKWVEVRHFPKTKKGEQSTKSIRSYLKADEYSDMQAKSKKAQPALSELPIFEDPDFIDWDSATYAVDVSGDKVTSATCYNSFQLVDKKSKHGNAYPAIGKGPCPIAGEWQKVDRLCFAKGGFVAVHDAGLKNPLDKAPEDLTLEMVEELAF